MNITKLNPVQIIQPKINYTVDLLQEGSYLIQAHFLQRFH